MTCSTRFARRALAARVAAMVALALAVLVGASASNAPSLHAPSAHTAEALVGYLNTVALGLLRQSPESVTLRGAATRLGLRNDALDSLVLDATGESYAPLEEALQRIASADLREASPTVRRAVESFSVWLQTALDGRLFQENVCLVSTYLTSIPQHLAWFMTHIHPLREAADAEDYLSRLAQIPTRFDELRVRLSQAEARHALAPGFLLARAADEIEAIGRGTSGELDLVRSFLERLGTISGLDAEAKEDLARRAQTLVERDVAPAYLGLAEDVRKLAARTTDDIGIWRQESGEAYYAYLLRAYTTTNTTADEIYDLGLREVSRVQVEVRAAAAALGYDASLPLPDLFARIRADSGSSFGDATVLACRELLKATARLVRSAFLTWPDELPTVEAGGRIAYFVDGAEDGSRPAAFYVPVDQVRPAYSLGSLVCHETVPGHFLQAAIARESGQPAFLDGVAFSAFAEGWATYAERLAWELGLYDGNPYGNLGRLQEELFRAARLVVDPGIHAKRWTYDEAVDYMIQSTGLDPATVRNEVDRYVVAPGQSVAYGIGFLEILRLREEAQQALGAAFDLAEFHQAVLSCGSVPLSVLEEIVDQFIEDHQPAAARDLEQ